LKKTAVALLIGMFILLVPNLSALGQEAPLSGPDEGVETHVAPKQVEVTPVAKDTQIADRLGRILTSTGWFETPSVKVSEGVVFLDGRTLRKENKDWAGDLARNTKDVVAVVNRIRVVERSPWDFAPALKNLRELLRETVRLLPQLAFGLLIFAGFVFGARGIGRLVRTLLTRQVPNPMLQEVGSRIAGIIALVAGLYVALHVVGLSRLAVTVLGGTGVAGLVIGFAFRDIMENFLASILISLRNPFQSGDLIEVAGHLGVVQRVTTRGTVLMDLDGNHVQIPNATIYKNTIMNFTANPRRRLSFEVGIGYETLIPHAQETALKVISSHPTVLHNPEPLVLVEKLGAATINLRIFFWIDGSVFDGQKVKSSLMRLVKRAFQDSGISMPDEAREVIFPQGVPVHMIEKKDVEYPEPMEEKPEAKTVEAVATDSEGDLKSQADEIREQASQSRIPEDGPNLLKNKTTRTP
jgi:small conductance mechanosensitive channel